MANNIHDNWKPPLRRLYAVQNKNIFYLVIPKCGCTYIKNLLWGIETGKAYHDPPNIHDKDKLFSRAPDIGATVEAVRNCNTAFTVLRDPTHRFFSLYADKVIGSGHNRFVPLRDILRRRYGLDVDSETIEGHQKNCSILLNWIERNFDGGSELAPDAHWTPQHFRGSIIEAFNLHIMILNNIDAQLDIILPRQQYGRAGVSDIASKNSSNTSSIRAEILSKNLVEKINKIYWRDRLMFDVTHDLWLSSIQGGNPTVPRAAEVFSEIRNRL